MTLPTVKAPATGNGEPVALAQHQSAAVRAGSVARPISAISSPSGVVRLTTLPTARTHSSGSARPARDLE